MKAFLLRCAIFAALLLSTLQVIDWAVPFYWGNDDLAVKMKYLRETGLRYDTMFLGSSRIYRQLDPLRFDEATGGRTRSFNLGSDAIFNPEIDFLYDRLLDDDVFSDVTLVVMELQSLHRITPQNAGTRPLVYAMDLASYRFARRVLAEIEPNTKKRSVAVVRYRTSFLQHLFKLHILKEMVEFIANPVEGDVFLGPARNGFSPIELQAERLLPSVRSDYLRNRKRTLERLPDQLESRRRDALRIYGDHETWRFSETHLRRLEGLVERSQQRGIEMIFVLPPRLPAEQLTQLLPIYQRLDPRIKIDLADPVKYPELYEMEYSFDRGHLNTKGAEVFTCLLIENFNALPGKNVQDSQLGAGGAPCLADQDQRP